MIYANEEGRAEVLCNGAPMTRQQIVDALNAAAQPIPMLIWCPACGARHIDEGEFSTKAHHTHACQSCGDVWRPAIVPTCGVQFLPGFKNPAA